jgi:hypothetical protein
MAANYYPPNTGMHNPTDRVYNMKNSRSKYTPAQIAAAEEDLRLYNNRTGPTAVNTKDNVRELKSELEYDVYTQLKRNRKLGNHELLAEYAEYRESGRPEVNLPDNFDELVADETNTHGSVKRHKTGARTRARARKRTRARARKRTRARARTRTRTRTRANRLR